MGATLLGNAISNDGDALSPAIAVNPRAAVYATAQSTIPALIIAYAFYFPASGFMNESLGQSDRQRLIPCAIRPRVPLRHGGFWPMAEIRLSFKEMCARFDVTPRTLRYYEYIELLSPQREGRSRYYGPRESARMTLVLRGRRFGFSLEEIRQWLLMYGEQGTAPQFEIFIEYADRQLKALSEQRNALNATIDELEKLRDEVSGLLG